MQEKYWEKGNCTRNERSLKEIMGCMLPVNQSGRDNEGQVRTFIPL